MPTSNCIPKAKFSLLLLAPVLILSACKMPTPQARDSVSETAASFVVESKEPKLTEQKMMSEFSIPESKTFHFEVCIRDLKQAKPILNHSFSISGKQAETLERSTDATGCLNWNETFPFNYFADGKFVEIDRTLTAKGLQKGSRTLRFAINPWENQAYDLDKTQIKNLVKNQDPQTALTSSDSQQKKSIFASDLRVNFTAKQTSLANGMTLNLEVRGSPSIESKKASGEVVLEPILEGQFIAQIVLIHTTVRAQGERSQIENRQAVFRSPEILTQSTRGLMSFQLPVTLANICTLGQYQLGVRLVAKLPEKLKAVQFSPFEGIFPLGECDQLKGNFFAVLSSESSRKGTSFSIEDYLKETPRLPESPSLNASGSAIPEGQQKAQFEITPLKATDLAYKDQEPLHRERQFFLETCVISGLDSKVVRAQTFTIKKANGSREQVVSNNQGCLKWPDSVKFEYLSTECEQELIVEINNSNLGLAQKIPLLVNPWSSNSNAIRDIRFLPSSAKAPRCARGKPEIIMTQYEFKRSSFSYDVDPSLNLKVKKTGIFNLSLTIKRPSLTESSGFAEESAPITDYVLRVALLDNETALGTSLNGKVSTIAEKQAHLSGRSTLSTSLTFESDNLKQLGSVQQIWIEVLPADPSSQVKPLVYRGTLTAAENFEGGPLEILSENENSPLETAKKARAQDLQVQRQLLQKISEKKAVAQDLKMDLINLTQEQESLELRKTLSNPTRFMDPASSAPGAQAPLSVLALKSWLDSGQLTPDLASRFCSYWFYDRLLRTSPAASRRLLQFSMMALNRNCLIAARENPGQFFDIQYRYIVKNPSVLEHRDGAFHDFSNSVSFNMGRSYSENHSQTQSLDAGINLSARTPEFLGATLGVSGGYRYSASWVKQWGEQTGTMQSYSSGTSMIIETLALKIRAQSLEKCALIKVRPEMASAENANALKSGLMICSGEASKTPMDFVENYYVLNQKLSGSGQILDASSSKNHPFFVALRGDHDFSSFLSFLTEGTGIPETYKAEFQRKSLLRDRSKALFQKGLPGSPGQLISPR